MSAEFDLHVIVSGKQSMEIRIEINCELTAESGWGNHMKMMSRVLYTEVRGHFWNLEERSPFSKSEKLTGFSQPAELA